MTAPVQCVVFYSGGLMSWAAGKRAVAKYGAENTTLLFTDTLIEDADLYRFLEEGATARPGKGRQTVLAPERIVDGQRRRVPMSLREFREAVPIDHQINLFDIGGCGCFLDEPEAA